MATLADDLVATAKATAREIINAQYFLLFFASKQRKILASLPEGVRHPSAALVQYYVEEDIPSHTGPPCSP